MRALALAALSLALLPVPLHAFGVVGTGSPASCTEAALDTALSGGGTVSFNCGGGPVTVPASSTLNYSAGQTRANSATVSLGPAGDVAVFCGQATGATDIILDMNGYFE